MLVVRTAPYHAARTMPLAPGTRIGAYAVEAALGAGAMGDVYRARDTRLPRRVAWLLYLLTDENDGAVLRIEPAE